MKKLSTIVLVGLSTCLTAQSFKTPIVNPFGFSPFGYVRNHHFSSFTDLDNDGDQDLLVSDFDGVFHYYENTGTSSNPMFSDGITNPFGISVIDYPNCSCNTLVQKFVDIDNDGDQDIIALSWWSSTYFFAENIGDKSTPNFTAFEKDLPWMPANFDRETFVGIDFVDIDDDGDLDFFSCEEDIFSFRENIGSKTDPNFSSELQLNAFGVNVSGEYLFPSFVDIDNDGDFDLFIGGNKPELNDFQFYENTGSKTSPVFTLPIQNPFDLTNSNIEVPSLTFIDIEGDGDKDIFSAGVLNDSNEFQYYENNEISKSTNDIEETDFNIFPNPATTLIHIESVTLDIPHKVEFINLEGKTIATLNLLGNSIDISNLSSGQYFIKTLEGAILSESPVIILTK